MQKIHLALWHQGLTVQLPIADEHVMDVASKEVAGAHVGSHPHYKKSPRAISLNLSNGSNDTTSILRSFFQENVKLFAMMDEQDKVTLSARCWHHATPKNAQPCLR